MCVIKHIFYDKNTFERKKTLTEKNLGLGKTCYISKPFRHSKLQDIIKGLKG